MHKSKLIKLFRGLSRSELLEFGRYLKTPFFNRDKNLLILYNYIKKYHPKLDSEKLDKEHFIKKITGEKDTKTRKIHDWMSDLSSKLEDYLILIETRKKSYTRDFLLLDAMKERKIDELFFRNVKNIGNKLDNSVERDMFYYFYQWQLKHEAFFYSSISKKYKDEKDIAKTMEYIDMFFCAVKLRYSGEMAIQELIVSDEHSIALLDEVLQEIQKPIYQENKLFEIYKLTLELFYEKRDETYNKLKSLVLKHLNLGNHDEKLTLLNFLMVHANKRLGEVSLQYTKELYERYTRELFELYVYKIENDLLLEDGYITGVHFYNIIYLATTLQRAEWLEKFIHTNTKYLNDNIRESTTNLANAYLHFAKKEYRQCLLTLLQMDSAYSLQTRTLGIQCHYEFEADSEVLTLECNNFNKYLNRNEKFAAFRKEYPKNFIRFVKMLIDAPYKKDMTKEKLHTKLNNTKRISARYWLDNKIDELRI